MSTPMTFDEFQKQAKRLHDKYPVIYRRKVQVELAFLVSGLPIEWFKFRVDYIIRSGVGLYDWRNAVRNFHTSPQRTETFHRAVENHQNALAALSAEEIADLNSVSYQNMLEENGVSSVVDLIQTGRGESDAKT